MKIIQEGSTVRKKAGAGKQLKDSRKQGSIIIKFTEDLSARKEENDGGEKNVGKMCAKEWEATWEVSWIQGCTQRGVICPSHAGARVHTSTQSLIPWLSSARASSSPLHHPRSAAGSPQQSSCRAGLDGDNGMRVAAGRAAREDGAAAAVPMTSPPAVAGTKSREAGWAKLFLLCCSNLNACKPHDSLAVPARLLQGLAAKSNPGSRAELSVSPSQGKPASSFPVADLLLGAQGGAVWAKPSGQLLGTIIRPLGSREDLFGATN